MITTNFRIHDNNHDENHEGNCRCAFPYCHSDYTKSSGNIR